MRSFALVLLEVIISMNNKETGELRQVIILKALTHIFTFKDLY